MVCESRVILVLFVLTALHRAYGGLFGDRDSSSKSQGMDPAATKFVNIMERALKKDYSKKLQPQPSKNISENTAVKNFVFRKFKGEMLQMFAFLPGKFQCNILRSLARNSNCSITDVTHVLSNESMLLDPKKLKCSFGGSTRASNDGNHNESRILDAFWDEMGSLFNNISVPFQCNIINNIATSSSRYRQKYKGVLKFKVPRITLQLAEQQIEVIFPFLNIKEKCSKVWKPLKKKVPLQSPAALLNITVRLKHGSKRKPWIHSLKKKAHLIYRIYYNYFSKFKKQRPLITKDKSPSNPPILDHNNVQLSIVRVTKANGTVSIIFGLEIRKPRAYFFTKISPAKHVITALKELGKPALNLFFNATVISITRSQQEAGQTEYVWSLKEIQETKRQFPKYLVSYYRQLDQLGRCLVMLYISSSLQMKLRPVELLYNSYRYVPKKYFCSSKRRITLSHKVKIETIYRGDTKSNPTKPFTQSITSKSKVTTEMKLWNRTLLENQEPTKFPIESDESADEKKVTPLEIGLFAILALLCVAILAFTVNCILFALKKKSSPKEQENVFVEAGLTGGGKSQKTEKKQEVQEIQNVFPQSLKMCSPSDDNHRPPLKCHIEMCTIPNKTSKELKLHINEYGPDPTCHADRNNSSQERNSTEDIKKCKKICCHSSESIASQNSIHGSKNSLTLSKDNIQSSEKNLESRQRTIKEGSGELTVVCDNADNPRGSASSDQNSDVCINNSKKVFVVLDQSIGFYRETCT